MAKKKDLPKWMYALRAGAVVAGLMIANYYLVTKALSVSDVYYGLTSGFVWFLIEVVRIYKIRLSPSLSGVQRRGCYTIILPKIP